MTVAVPITRNIQVKTPLTPEKKDELFKQISEAYGVIREKNFEIENLKERTKVLKEAVEQQQSIVASIVAVYDKGFEEKTVECYAKYENGEATFTDIKTGEIVEQRTMNDSEQMMLSTHAQDAEDFIRQANKEEDESEDEG